MTWGMMNATKPADISKEIQAMNHYKRYDFNLSSTNKEAKVSLTDNITYVITWRSDSAAQQSFYANTPEVVDIRSASLYEGAGVDSTWNDGVTLTSTPLVTDGTLYVKSQETPMIRLRDSKGSVFEIDIIVSASGRRTTVIVKTYKT